MEDFKEVKTGIISLLEDWLPILSGLPHDVIALRRNNQNRTIRQIIGHLVDSASNNIHRIVHLQYRENPLDFPNYASNGNNDRWIAIQNYQEENWNNLLQLWKYSNLHLLHVIAHINPAKLDNQWMASPDKKITLREMVVDYLRHFKLHLYEIEELINTPNSDVQE